MTRHIISFILFLALFIIEISFFSSLPYPISLTPLVFASSVYLLQHQDVNITVFWLFFYGAGLSILHLNIAPFEPISYSIAALVAFFSAKHIFSNRSFYGVCACLFSSYVALFVMQTLFIFIQTGTSHRIIHWGTFLQFQSVRLLMMLILIFIFFPLAGRIKKILIKTFLLSEQQRTY